VATLADIFNSPETFEYEGTTYTLREPTLPECGEYQKWLEAEARASAAASTELPERDRRRLLSDVIAEIAAKRYAWGGLACVESLSTAEGIGKLMSIVCRDQGVTYALGVKIATARLWDIARMLLATEQGDDPEKKEMVRQLLRSVGRPQNFLSDSSSGSSTPTTAGPPPSTPSGACPPAS
jgi:hypothetical protein